MQKKGKIIERNMLEQKKPKNKQKSIFGVPLQVFIMGLVSLFTDISSEMIQSILPLFILSIGGTLVILGLISGITTAIANIFKGISGWMSDKLNRKKPFIVAGYFISNISKPFIGLSPSWEIVLALKASDRFGKGIRTSSRDALISYYSAEKGKIFGIHRAMDTTGAVAGSLLAFLLLFFAWTYRQLILFSIIPGIIAIILIFKIKEVDPYELELKLGIKKEKPKIEKLNKNFIKLIIILGVIEFASLDLTFLIIRATDYISTNLIFLIPIFYLISNIVYVLFSPINGSLSDKYGRKPIIIIGLSVLLASCIFLAFPIEISIFSIVLIVIIFGMFGFYLASVDPISRAYIADLVDVTKRGQAYGYYYLSVGLISLVESLIFGLIYEVLSFTGAFIYASILLFICIILFTITDFPKIAQKQE